MSREYTLAARLGISTHRSSLPSYFSLQQSAAADEVGSRPLVVYFHRYPIEIETFQYPAARPIIDRLLVNYDVLYVSMKGRQAPDLSLRRGLRIMELPLTVSQSGSLDKWFKSILYYMLLPYILLKLRNQKPAFILYKEIFPFVSYAVSLLQIPMIITEVSDWWWSIVLGGTALGRRCAEFLETLEVRLWNRSRHLTVVVHSQAAARHVQQMGMAADRIRVINTAMPSGVYGPLDAKEERARLGFDKGLWVVATHGIIRPGKGYGQMLAWWKRLAALHKEWRLLIIGGAGGESWCRNQIRRLELEQGVTITGWLPTQHDVNRYLNAADCLLVIRRNSPDNLGIIPSALYHSMSTGKPTVATGLPGMSEIVRHGVDGYLFEPDSFESFKCVLEFVAAHPDEASQVGQAGIQRCKECFDPDLAAQRHVELIDELLQKERRLTQ